MKNSYALLKNYWGGVFILFFLNISPVLAQTGFTLISTEMRVTPNPTTGLLTLKSQNGLKSYKLFDLQGRMVKHGGLPNNQINLSGLENGFYILRVHGQNGAVSNLKVVKQ